MKINELEAAVEAILFASGDSVSLETLQKALGLDARTVKSIVHKLGDYYESDGRSIRLIELDDCFQLCTHAKFSGYIAKAVETPRKRSLTPPLIETLAIIAYKQPVTKSAIEEIRGVNADHAVNKLVEYGLVTETGRLESPGRPVLFGTTEEFLRHFGFKNLKMMPNEELFPVCEED